jgi:hypothetical protein
MRKTILALAGLGLLGCARQDDSVAPAPPATQSAAADTATPATSPASNPSTAGSLPTTSPFADGRPVVRAEVEDGLQFPDGVLHAASEPIVIYAHVPENWVANGSLTDEAKVRLLAKLYGGPDWEKGNSDGSKYVVRSFKSRSLSVEEILAPIWAGAKLTGTWFYETLPDGTLEKRGVAFGPDLPDPEPERLPP